MTREKHDQHTTKTGTKGQQQKLTGIVASLALRLTLLVALVTPFEVLLLPPSSSLPLPLLLLRLPFDSHRWQLLSAAHTLLAVRRMAARRRCSAVSTQTAVGITIMVMGAQEAARQPANNISNELDKTETGNTDCQFYYQQMA